MDFDGRLRWVSASHEKLLGYAVAELLGVSYLDLAHPADRADMDGAIDAVVTGAETAGFEARLRGRDGSMRFLRFTIFLGREEASIRSVAWDVTREKRREHELARAAAIVQTTDDAILTKDCEGIITGWNPGAERLYGYSADEIEGQPISRLIPAHREGEEREILSRIMRGERIDHYETERVRKDGALVEVSLSVSPIRDSSGRIVEASAIARDVSERRAFERRLGEAMGELERRSEDLARSNEDLEQFAYAVSHDLSEPLRMVSSYVQLLARRYEGKLDEDADEFIWFAVDGANRMHDLIEGLLQYSRAGRAEYARRPVDLERVLRDTLLGMESAIGESGARIELSDLPTVCGDATQLSRVFQNLLDNAIKFTEAGPPRIEISAQRDGSSWRLAVSDNGIGIEPAHAQRAFVVFQRLNERDRYAGSGIGLALCKRIVERGGGKIWVEPRPGGGSTFYFTVPAE